MEKEEDSKVCQVCNTKLVPRMNNKSQNEKYKCGCGKITCKLHKWPDHKCPLDYYEQE